MFGIGAPELVLILVIALIFIGPKKLPEVARTFGKGYREFQSALDGVKRDFHEAGENLKNDVEASVKEEPAAKVEHPAELSQPVPQVKPEVQADQPPPKLH
jgi:Tat protein translocase TatB subunit